MIVCDQTGREYVIERHVGPKGGPVSIKRRGSVSESVETLSTLLGEVNRPLFQQVFAFGLDELAQLGGPEVEHRIYGAGMGAEALRAEMTLKHSQDDIFRVGGNLGSTQAISPLLKQAKEIDDKLKQHANDAPKYAQLIAEIAEVQSEVNRLDRDREGLASKRDHCQRLLQGWDNLLLQAELANAVAHLPEYNNFPGSAMARLDGLERRNQEEKKELTEAEHRASQAAEEASLPIAGSALLEDESSVTEAIEKRTSLESALRDLPKIRAEWQLKRDGLDARLASLGQGWNDHTIGALDTSLAIRAEIDQLKSTLDASSKQRAEAEQALRTAQQEVATSRSEVQCLEDQFAQLPAPELDEAQIARSRQAAQRANLFLQEVGREGRRLADLKGQVTPPGETVQTESRPLWLVIALVAVGIIATVSGLLMEAQPIYAAVVGLLFWAGAGALYFVAARQPHASTPATSPVLRVQIADAEHRHETALAELLRLSKQLGIEPIDEVALGAVNGRLDTMASMHTQGAKLAGQLADARRNLSKRCEWETSAQQILKQLAHKAESQTNDWHAWLVQKGLASTLTPEKADQFLDRVEGARADLTQLAGLQKRITAMESSIAEGQRIIGDLERRHGPVRRQQTLDSLVRSIDDLKQSLEAARQAHTRAATLRQRVSDTQVDAENHRRSLAQLEQAVGVLLQAGGTSDVEEFRRRAVDHETRKEKIRELDKTEASIRALFGTSASVSTLQDDMAATSRDAHRNELEHLKAHLEQIVTDSQQLGTRMAECKVRLDQLVSDQTASELRLQRQGIVARLGELAQQWSHITVALTVLQIARQQYERERQPRVIKEAEHFFKTFTAGRYVGVQAPLGQQLVEARLASGVTRRPGELSRGTREQLYLALRFGVIREFSERGIPLPVIVDDALVNFDPTRARAAATAFAQLAESNQVLVFTCHPHMATYFTEACPNAKLIRLEANQ